MFRWILNEKNGGQHKLSATKNRFLLDNSQCTRGADLRTLAAVDTVCNGGRIVELRTDDRLESAAHQAQNGLARHFITGPHTEVAEDTLSLVTLNANQFFLHKARMLLTFQTLRVNLIEVGAADELTVGIVVAAALQTAAASARASASAKPRLISWKS